MTDRFGPRSDAEAILMAGERYRVDLQCRVAELIASRGIDRDDLAYRLGAAALAEVFADRDDDLARCLGRALLHQLCLDECAVSVVELGRILFAIGATGDTL